MPEVRALPSAGITRPRQYYDPVRRPPVPQPKAPLEPQPPNGRASPDYPRHLPNVPCPLPRRAERVHMSIASPFARPSPLFRRVGAHVITFEACSDFTRVTARRFAQPPEAAFVTRLRSGESPHRTARQLPDQSTTLWVEPSSTGNTRLRGALNNEGAGFANQRGLHPKSETLSQLGAKPRISAVCSAIMRSSSVGRTMTVTRDCA
jgi:hypothetical protein